MTSPPVATSVEHWSFQVDSPFRGPAEIRELAGTSRRAADAGPAEVEGVFGEDLAQAEEEFEAYDEYEPSSEAEAYDEAEPGEASLLEEAPASEHPLAAVFSLPRLAFDAMARGGWPTAIAIAVGSGLRDVNQLTNMVFWFRHPQLIGQKIRADQGDLAREWLQIRDQVVRPALAGRAPTTPTAPSTPSAPAPTMKGTRTSIPADGLLWFGPPSEESPELIAFMRKVYDLHVKRSKGDFVDTLPESALDQVESGKKARKDAAAKAREMLAAARAALAAEGLTGTVRIGVLSAYRSADHQFDIWQGKTTKGSGGFPHYYAKTKATRQHPRYGGEHSDKAAAYLAEYMAQYVAAPGYSNHQDGLALDLGTRKGKGGLIKLYKGSWLHNWLTANASKYQFKPLASEAWHWTYRPTPGRSASEAWSSEVAPAAVTAGSLEVPRIPLLASHRGRAPDLILRWNDMPTVPTEIDVVVHLHGYSWATMTLPKHMEVWAGLDLGPVDGASGLGRTRPTLTVLPRGHFTGIQVGKIYRYTFPALTTKDGLTTLVRVALERFSARVGGSPPRVGRLILTAHSGGGAPLMQILRRHDPQEVHVFDGLYQDATPLADWASRHIKADRLAVQGGAAPASAMRVFFGPSTRRFSLRLHNALAADLQDAPASIRDRYRVESSRLGHWQIARQYGWRVLAEAAADVPGAVRPAPPRGSVKRLFEVDAAEMPFLSETPFLPEAPFLPDAVGNAETDEAEAWELGEWDTEGETEPYEAGAEDVYEEESGASELERVGAQVKTEGGSSDNEYGETDPELQDAEAAVGLAEAEADSAFADWQAEGAYAEAEGAFAEPEAEGAFAEAEGAFAEPEAEGAFAEPEAEGAFAEAEGAFAEPEAEGMEGLEQGEIPAVDKRKTTSWAIASVGGGGFIVGYSVFLLVNRETGRQHQMHVPTGGLSTYFGVASAGSPSYTTFETSRAVSFADFDGIGVRLTTANIGVFFGYSIVYLTLWAGPAYVSDRLASIRMSGWGAMIPGGAVAHGITKIAYGSGTRSGVVPLVIAPQPDDTVREPAMASIRLAAKESPRVALPNEMLFAFDSAEIKPAAQTALLYLADLLNNRMRLPVEIEGHTDSTGSSTYNLALSARRAEAVKRWFVDRGVHGASDFRAVPYGEAKPIATNSTAEGRRRNRRVVINASWSL